MSSPTNGCSAGCRTSSGWNSPGTRFARALAMSAGIFAGGLPSDAGTPAPGYPDVGHFRQDLDPPAMTIGAPAAGKRVRAALPGYGYGVYHALYLPPDWHPGGRYPVVVEY